MQHPASLKNPAPLPVTAYSDQLTHPRYRADIDGLRAIAVLAVVGFHAFPHWVRGGFIGVDVFFVISGFLISTIIFDNLRRNTFDFFEFYARRVRRIFPALLLVLIAAGALGWFVLFPDEYQQLGKHIAAGAAFIFNFVVWNESGYFDGGAARKPLLHLWSLGIEEQFYIFWPLILWLAWRRRLNLLAITAGTVAISFGLCIFTTIQDVTAAFYSPQTRFWELSIGSSLAYVMLPRPRDAQLSHAGASLRSILGAALLLVGIFVVSRQTAFPGAWALLPTLGTGLMIFSGTHAWPNRVVLATPALVWFGKISYPLYLWHWVLLSFAQIIRGDTPPPAMRATAVAVAIALAWFTFKYVESPIRFGRHQSEKTICLLILMAVVGVLGLTCNLQAGLPWRLRVEPANATALFGVYPHRPFHNAECDRAFPIFKDFDGCLLSKSGRPDVLLLGDSHSTHLYKSLAKRLETHVVMNVSQSSCLPFSSEAHHSHYDCAEKLRTAANFVSNSDSIKTVYIAGYWGYLAAAGFIPENDGWQLPLHLSANELNSFRHSADLMLSSLATSGRRVVLVLDTPGLPFDPRACVKVQGSFLIKYRMRTAVNGGGCFVTRRAYEDRVTDIDKTLSQIVGGFPEVKVFNPRPLLCDAAVCPVIKNNVVLYDDRDHLTIEGADLVVAGLVTSYPPPFN